MLLNLDTYIRQKAQIAQKTPELNAKQLYTESSFHTSFLLHPEKASRFRLSPFSPLFDNFLLLGFNFLVINLPRGLALLPL